VDDNLEYIWDKSFIVGHDLIDSQHKEHVNAVNSMICSCSSGTREGFDSSIKFLGNYVVKIGRYIKTRDNTLIQVSYPREALLKAS